MFSANSLASSEPEFNNPSAIRCCSGAHPFGKSLFKLLSQLLKLTEEKSTLYKLHQVAFCHPLFSEGTDHCCFVLDKEVEIPAARSNPDV
jgi:hypothetical protein